MGSSRVAYRCIAVSTLESPQSTLRTCHSPHSRLIRYEWKSEGTASSHGWHRALSLDVYESLFFFPCVLCYEALYVFIDLHTIDMLCLQRTPCFHPAN